DPVGGSFTIESLTDRLEAEAADLIRETDRRGGMLKAIETGWVQRQIADSAYRVQVELARGGRMIVGVNAYVEGEERVPLPKPDPRLEPERVRRVRAFRAKRSPGEVDSHLHRLEDEARSDGNLMPAILDSVRAKATLGEISDVLRTVFGLQAEARSMIGPAHHVGIAVKSLQEALEGYRRLGLEPDVTQEVPSQGVRVAFLRSGAVRVELLES